MNGIVVRYETMAMSTRQEKRDEFASLEEAVAFGSLVVDGGGWADLSFTDEEGITSWYDFISCSWQNDRDDHALFEEYMEGEEEVCYED